MIAPAAPLEKAVETFRRALDKVHHFDRQGDSGICEDESHVAGEALLAALDADKRLEEAEAALRDIGSVRCNCEGPAKLKDHSHFHDCEAQSIAVEIARRYFARREGEKGKVPE